MNEKINTLSKQTWEAAVAMFDEIEDIRVTLVNIRILVASMQNNQNAKGLDVIANQIQESLVMLTERSKIIRDAAKEIGKENAVT